MATFGELKTDVSARLIDSSNTAVSSANVAAAINSAQRFWKGKRFWFNETYSTVTYTPSTATNSYSISMPSDFWVDIPSGAMNITDSGEIFTIRKIRPEVFDTLGVTGSTGRPTVYCVRRNQIEVKPYPDRTYSGNLWYLKNYSDFVNTTEDSLSNDFTTYAPELITLQALSRLYAEFRQDLNLAEYFAGKAREEYSMLKDKTQGKNNTGTLTIET